MSGVLHLASGLADMIREDASRAYPDECCGLIEGTDDPDGWTARAVHPAANLAEDRSRRFLIDPQTQFELMRRLRDTEARMIGCYHSHPDGVPEPSARDRAEAFEPGFLYLIAAGAPRSGFVLKAYRFNEAGGFCPVACGP